MKCIPIVMSIAMAGTAFPSPAQRASIDARSLERIAQERDRAASRPRDFQWSPSGNILAFIETAPETNRMRPSPAKFEIRGIETARGNQLSLVTAADLTGIFGREAPKLPEEKEEDAIPHTQLAGYAWAQDGKSMLLYTRDSLAWFDTSAHSGRLILRSQEDLGEPAISPDGYSVSFIKGHTLWIADVKSGAAHPVSRGGTTDLREGEPDWLYRHEMQFRAAYWWAPESGAIAWLEIDDRAVDKYTLRKSDGDDLAIAFPKPGRPLPGIRLQVKFLKTGTTRAIDIGAGKNAYVPVVRWLPDGKHIAFERLSRDQKTLDLVIADTVTGASRIVLSEKDAYWINLSDDLRFLSDSRRFLWSSERSGFRHLYLYDVSGRQLAQLTRGDWEVTSVAGVDEAAGQVYFIATEASALERRLYSVSLDGSGFRRITPTRGTHDATLSPDGRKLLDQFSDHSTPPEFDLLGLDGSRISPIGDDRQQLASFTSSTEYLTIKTHMGVELNASITRPADFSSEKKYPVIFFVAGGPGEQLVRDIWGGDVGMWRNSMAQLGYIIFSLDNQGTSGRGHTFEEPVHLRFASQEMSDILDGIMYLHSLPWVDGSRIGICGFGFGGFLALHGMLGKPALFKAGFAGEPVSDWHFYDAFFTERYLDDPDRNQDGWLSSSPLENAKKLSAPLLIAQATLDDRFHIENSLSLLDELLDKGKYADILLFADRRSLFDDRGTRTVLFQRMTEFFLKNL